MNAVAENPRAVPGGNNPPEPTPYEKAGEEITVLYSEAEGWLDGVAVDTQDMADGLAKLLNLLRDARKVADEARKVEAKPFDDGKAEVQARYKPLLEKADRATDVCKKALAPWLTKLEREKAEAAAAARREAEGKAAVAQAAIRAAPVDNLAEREAAEELLKAAKKADAAANRAERDTAKASSGGVGRAVSLRTTYRPVLTDGVAAARHYWQARRPEFEAFLLSLAEHDVRQAKRDIPGFDVVEEKTAA